MEQEKAKAVIATGNPHKLLEIKKMLEDFPIEVVSMKEVGLENMEIEETGASFEENALIKAMVVCEETNTIALADDSGLEVDALDGRPGIHSARYAGEGATDRTNKEKLLNELQGVPIEKRSGRFVCAIAVAFPNEEVLVTRGEVEGYIDFEETGENGFGYDPMFYVPEYQKTFGQLEPEIKNRISHRSKALENLKKMLTEHFKE
ncbi:XTP/dITP diphosphatase [Tindallia californiensis]|uniref:dITP/XTP pyrophosphatase n=1 Tax=Tindallia californiensis TaxID=159292 RepID=A0A1H3KH13_9FIRM|nr:XTP/dITP diphosphatase [Tindallia californiensis]SDY51492.1 XTP/dITP diphosphohydrolase [Tindallia californiensis]